MNPSRSKCSARRSECKNVTLSPRAALSSYIRSCGMLASPACSLYHLPGIPCHTCMYAQCCYECMLPLVSYGFEDVCLVNACRHTRCSCSFVCFLFITIAHMLVSKCLHASRPHLVFETKCKRQGVGTSQRCRSRYQPHTLVYQ